MRAKFLTKDRFGLICFFIFATLSVIVAYAGGDGWEVGLPPFVGALVLVLRQIFWPPRHGKRMSDLLAIFFLIMLGITALY